MIEPLVVREYKRSSYHITMEETADAIQRRYKVHVGVFDGVKVQWKTEGVKYGYTQRGRAAKVYEAKVAQIDEMLTKQGR